MRFALPFLILVFIAAPHAHANDSDADGAKARALAELAKITLPDNPTRQDVERYVTAIIDAKLEHTAQARRIAMIQEVPTEHFDVLLREDFEVKPGHRFISFALTGETAERFKPQILNAMVGHHWLFWIAQQNEWLDEAGLQLVEAVNADPLHAPYPMLRHAAKANGLAVKDAMFKRLLAGPDRTVTYRSLARIPELDPAELDAAVGQAWERVSADPDVDQADRHRMARIAVRHGRVDALDTFVDRYRRRAAKLNESELTDRKRERIEEELRELVIEHFGFTGKPGEFYAWYDRVKDRLKWNAASRKYWAPTAG